MVLRALIIASFAIGAYAAEAPVGLKVPSSDRRLSDAIKASPGWELAFVREGDLWVAHADGSHLARIAKLADSPVWSHNGRLLAYRQSSNLCVLDFERNHTVMLSKRLDINDGDVLQMTFDPQCPSLVVAIGEGLRVYDLQVSGLSDDILTQLNWTEGSPTWSPTGAMLAFTRNGDVWVASRDVERSRAAGRLSGSGYEGGFADQDGFTVDYYDDARRLAALAVWNDGEIGVSARTPFWVDDLAWTTDERRIAFHFQRIGGSGVSQIGYLELEPVPLSRSWADECGFKVTTHWLTSLDEFTFCPRICPDGETLSFINEGYNLCLADWEGKSRHKLLENVDQFAWRPMGTQP